MEYFAVGLPKKLNIFKLMAPVTELFHILLILLYAFLNLDYLSFYLVIYISSYNKVITITS